MRLVLPLLVLLIFCTCVPALLAAEAPPATHPDQDALVAFYNATSGPDWIDKTGWLDPGCDVCDWFGITCNPEGRVERLSLSDNNLAGELPEEIGNLQFLSVLRLSFNNLSGSIPTTVGQLENLTSLILGFNELTGSIPDLAGAEQLVTLALSANNLTGSIPLTILNLPLLEFLYLSDNQLSGPWPDISALTTLREIYVRNNNFNGPLPELSQPLPQLERLSVGGNFSTGVIPASWLTSLPALEIFLAVDLQLSGALPDISGWPSLLSLNLSDNDFSGCYPANYSALCDPTDFTSFANNPNLPDGGSATFFDNEFCANGTTCAPCAHPDFDALVALYAGTNGANWTDNTGWADGAAGTDCTPCDWFGITCNTDDRVTRISLLNNGLTGTIEDVNWPELSELEQLVLSLNDISGRFPQSLWFLNNLVQINLQDCNLGGNFPSPGSSAALRVLDIAGNNFINAAPIFGDCPVLNTVNIRDNNFEALGESGFDVTRQPNLTTLLAQNNNFFEPLPEALGDYPPGQISQLRFDGNNFVGCYPANYDNLCGATTNFTDNAGLPNEGNADFFQGEFCDGGYGCPTDCHPDYTALVDFYHSTNGDDWTDNTGWLADCNVCDWQGITCLGDRVSRILLSNNNLGGTLPASLAELDQLQRFNITVNNVGGSIPPELGALGELRHFRVRVNALSGEVPTELREWSQMEIFESDNNDLSGPLLRFTSSPNLTDYTASNNNHEGTIPEDLVNSTIVNRIALSGNNLTGELPRLFGDLPLLTQLFLPRNQLTGCYPDNYVNLCGDNVNFLNNPGLPDGGSNAFFQNQFCSDPNACATLPVTWISFAAVPTAKTVELRWVTAEETDNAGFVVERSADGHRWSALSDLALVYDFVDEAPLPGESLYRIRQTDLDGSVSYSELRRVRFSGEGTVAYPTPFSGTLTVVSASADEVRVVDLAGRERARFRHAGDGAQVQRLQLPAGMYVLHFVRSGQVVRVVAK